ncbi:hypothetical protein IEQ34_019071 [Dendrobium chrysotoxum]|uniref:eIF-(iso)4F 25 kDa subunit n=1 Tax=Dendrobium chrysotoxum TaxID=161865 RepID=A0AAV7G8E5_DENCH|nr:hypothetical protein IEQ34_019071 [Dendrobium chrysotoxum]
MAEIEAEAAAQTEAREEVEGGVLNRQPHKLERKWTFWFDNQSKVKQGAAWGSSLRKVYTFDTVEEFWCLYDQIFRPSKLPANADFHCFKAGIEPKWEDPECANGGKWSISSSRKANLDSMWLETIDGLSGFSKSLLRYYSVALEGSDVELCAHFSFLQVMALIGEQFDDNEEICGVVASVRPKQDKLALWTKTASNEAVQMSIGRKWKEIVDTTDKIVYSYHDDSRRDKSSRGGRYSV